MQGQESHGTVGVDFTSEFYALMASVESALSGFTNIIIALVLGNLEIIRKDYLDNFNR